MIKVNLTEDELLALVAFMQEDGSMNEHMHARIGRKLTIVAAKVGLLDHELEEMYDSQTTDLTSISKSSKTYDVYASKPSSGQHHTYAWHLAIYLGSEYIGSTSVSNLDWVESRVTEWLLLQELESNEHSFNVKVRDPIV